MLGISNIGSICYGSVEFIPPQKSLPSFLVSQQNWKSRYGTGLVEGMTGSLGDHAYTLQDSSSIKVKLSYLNDPESDSDHVFIYTTKGSCTVKLISGTTTIDTWVENDSSDTTHVRLLTTQQAGLIDYSDLYIEVTT